MRAKAFTLIELLIVVAIIAILAAIAVPNFLEAQVRSKVSRAKTDMRSIAVAVESYMVDHTKFPPDGDDTPLPGAVPYAQKEWYHFLTTPVAYLTSAPSDPFNVVRHFPDPADPYGAATMTATLFPGEPPHPYAYLTQGANSQNPYRRPSQPVHEGNPTQYGIVSLGPDQMFDSAAEQGINDTYDATNGTRSRGDIIRNGPGQ